MSVNYNPFFVLILYKLGSVKMKENLTMLLDLYELTMANGIFYSKEKDTICYFDMFF